MSSYALLQGLTGVRYDAVLELGVGFQYSHKMSSKNADKVPGAKEFTPAFSLAVHLPLGRSGY